MKLMKPILAAASTLAVALIIGCGGSGSASNTMGTLSLGLTDAPLTDEANVSGVYITITGIEYHTSEDGWQEMEEFNTSVNPINLLDWQDGKTIKLGDFQMPAGTYTQIRFKLDAVEEQQKPKANPGCYITIDDVNHTLYVPSGSQTGFKGVGTYVVPVNGEVQVTADFDVRKSVVVTGKGEEMYYKLKPTIKLVMNNEAGKIAGTISNLDANSSYIVYAYEYDANGITTWDENETIDPDPSDATDERFMNAVSSDSVNPTDGSFMISFLAPGTYDLVIAQYDGNGNFVTTMTPIDSVVVESLETTDYDRTL